MKMGETYQGELFWHSNYNDYMIENDKISDILEEYEDHEIKITIEIVDS